MSPKYSCTSRMKSSHDLELAIASAKANWDLSQFIDEEETEAEVENGLKRLEAVNRELDLFRSEASPFDVMAALTCELVDSMRSLKMAQDSLNRLADAHKRRQEQGSEGKPPPVSSSSNSEKPTATADQRPQHIRLLFDEGKKIRAEYNALAKLQDKHVVELERLEQAARRIKAEAEKLMERLRLEEN